MAYRAKKTRRQTKKPETVTDHIKIFVARRIVDSIAFLFAGLSIFLAGALFSYAKNDPSLNVSNQETDTNIQNIFGAPGANMADLVYQTAGFAGWILPFIFMAWAVILYRQRRISLLWLRIPSLCLALLCGALALSTIPSYGFLHHPFAGSSFGALLFNTLSLAPFFKETSLLWIGFSGLLALGFFLFATGMNKEQMIWARRKVWQALKTLCLWVFNQVKSICEWIAHYNDPDYQIQNEKKRVQPVAPKLSSPKEEEVTEPENILPPKKPEEIRIETKQTHASPKSIQKKLFGSEGEWEFPGLDLIQEIPEDHDEHQLDENALRINAELLQNVLNDFNVKGEIVSIHPGPVVTLYEFEPAPGTKTSRVISLSDDIARSMSAVSVRAAVVPGRNVIGIELPNKKRQTVFLRELLVTRDYEKTGAKLPLILGKNIGGKPIIADLARMPHLLVAGTTGSGKSVAVNTMILSLLFRLPPEKCRFIMIDPKMLELSVYDNIPHLLSPVVTDPGRAVVSLKWTVQEMEERYRAMSKLGVRNIEGYNARLKEALKKGEVLMRKVQTGFDAETGKPVYEEQPLDMTELPYIVVVVDEFADLMLVAGKEVENAIQRLAQMARAAGIHLIMATQRPSVDVITGVIKANFPTRISFQVTSKIDSRTILGEGGAEQLLGMGDMLYMAPGGQITRVHGPFAADDDVENVVTFLKNQSEPSYLEDITSGGGEGFGGDMFGDLDDDGEKVDDLYDQAVAIVARERKASTSFIQRHLQIGYNRAARIVEEMEKQGVIGPANHVGKREILVQDLSDVDA